MEFIPGGTLAEWIKFRHKSTHEKELYEEEAKAVLNSLLQGLTFIHEKDYIHRDIKPDNIMFTIPGNTSTLKIADFGLSAKYKGCDTESETCGTTAYMAPEMLKRQAYNSVL